ncbi:hypothetical protein IWW38_002325, partial [Coemansia aciculifera]
MDIDDDTLHAESQDNALTNSSASTQHTMGFDSGQTPTRAEENIITTTTTTTTTTTMTRTLSQAMEDTTMSDNDPQAESTPYPETTLYSPAGLAMSLAIMEHSESMSQHISTDVQSLLPDAHGICHYHRPSMLMHRARHGHEGAHGLPRSLFARNYDFIQRQSIARIEANQRAMEQVVRRLAVTRRCLIPPDFGHERYTLDRSAAVAAVAKPPKINEITYSPTLPEDDGLGDYWVSDSEDKPDNDDSLTQDTYDLLLRMQVRVAARRANSGGIS